MTTYVNHYRGQGTIGRAAKIPPFYELNGKSSETVSSQNSSAASSYKTADLVFDGPIDERGISGRRRDGYQESVISFTSEEGEDWTIGGSSGHSGGPATELQDSYPANLDTSLPTINEANITKLEAAQKTVRLYDEFEGERAEFIFTACEKLTNDSRIGEADFVEKLGRVVTAYDHQKKGLRRTYISDPFEVLNKPGPGYESVSSPELEIDQDTTSARTLTDGTSAGAKIDRSRRMRNRFPKLKSVLSAFGTRKEQQRTRDGTVADDDASVVPTQNPGIESINGRQPGRSFLRPSGGSGFHIPQQTRTLSRAVHSVLSSGRSGSGDSQSGDARSSRGGQSSVGRSERPQSIRVRRSAPVYDLPESDEDVVPVNEERITTASNNPFSARLASRGLKRPTFKACRVSLANSLAPSGWKLTYDPQEHNRNKEMTTNGDGRSLFSRRLFSRRSKRGESRVRTPDSDEIYDPELAYTLDTEGSPKQTPRRSLLSRFNLVPGISEEVRSKTWWSTRPNSKLDPRGSDNFVRTLIGQSGIAQGITVTTDIVSESATVNPESNSEDVTAANSTAGQGGLQAQHLRDIPPFIRTAVDPEIPLSGLPEEYSDTYGTYISDGESIRHDSKQRSRLDKLKTLFGSRNRSGKSSGIRTGRGFFSRVLPSQRQKTESEFVKGATLSARWDPRDDSASTFTDNPGYKGSTRGTPFLSKIRSAFGGKNSDYCTNGMPSNTSRSIYS